MAKTEPASNGGGTTGITDLGREEKLHNCSQRQDWEYVRKQLCRHQCQWKRKGRSNQWKTNKHLKKHLWRKRCTGGAISKDDIEWSHEGNSVVLKKSQVGLLGIWAYVWWGSTGHQAGIVPTVESHCPEKWPIPDKTSTGLILVSGQYWLIQFPKKDELTLQSSQQWLGGAALQSTL